MSYPPPKPGERYRLNTTGREYILSHGGTLINLATGAPYALNPFDPFDGDRNEFVRIQPPEEAPAPIKLVAGHDYQCRNGKTTGPLQYKPDSSTDDMPWLSPKLCVWYTMNGRSCRGGNENERDIVKDLGPVKPPKPELGDVYRRKDGGVFMVMRSGDDPHRKLELRCVGGNGRAGNWWHKGSEDLFSGCEADFEFVGNDCLKVV